MAIIGPLIDSHGTLILASSDANGGKGNGRSDEASLSADGQFVAFYSLASNLVPDDTNKQYDVFVKNLQTGEIVRASTDVDGDQGNGHSNYGSTNPSLSADGRYAAFHSWFFNLVAGDTNDAYDIFIKDLQTGDIVRASTSATGGQANDGSGHPSLSADGRYVAFGSSGSNFGSDTNHWSDIYVKDLLTGKITRASTDSFGRQANGNSQSPTISADGRYVAFLSLASNLVPGDTNGGFGQFDVFVKDLQTGKILRASTDANGNEGNNTSDSVFGLSLSADGRYVAFLSYASNLVPNDTNGTADVFVKDLQTGAIVCASADADDNQGNSYSYAPSLSADGRYVAFHSLASNLVPGDTDDTFDVFVKDLQSGEIVRVSTSSAGNHIGKGAFEASLSADGSTVAFGSAGNIFVKTVGSAVSGTGEDDQITDSFAADTIAGWAGNDLIEGKAGDDIISGNDGNDTVHAGDGADQVTGHLGADSLNGDAGDDTIDGLGGNDTVDGGDGDDRLTGGSNFDTLYGGSGDDTLDGGTQADRLYGGRGDDRLTGGQGLDWFVYAKPAGASGNLGHDVITDFADDYDKIRLAGYTAAEVSIDNDHKVVTLTDGTTITLENFTGTLNLGDFLFA